MAKLTVVRGTTSNIFLVEIPDVSSAGIGLTGLAYNTSGLVCKKIASGGTLSAAVTIEDITTLGTYQAPTSNAHMRFKEVSSSDPAKGLYEIHVHNDWLNPAAGINNLVIMLAGAANMPNVKIEIAITDDQVQTGDAYSKVATLTFTGSNVNAQVKAQDNIDFGALQKTSLNAATPASVQNIAGQTGDTYAAAQAISAALATHDTDIKAAISALSAQSDYASVIDDVVTTSGKITQQRIYVYNNKTNADTHDKATGLIATFLYTDAGGKIEMVKE